MAETKESVRFTFRIVGCSHFRDYNVRLLNENAIHETSVEISEIQSSGVLCTGIYVGDGNILMQSV